MRKTILLLSLLMPAIMVTAQSWVKKASKGVFTLKTFDKEGSLLGNATGFFTTATGDAVSCLEPFKGAERAVVIDAQGKEWPVERILGANSTYDVVKFRVAVKKAQPLTVATEPLNEGGEAWQLPYREVKKAVTCGVRRRETFNGHFAYYTIGPASASLIAGTPLLDGDGAVVGVMQAQYSETDTVSYAVSSLFADSLTTTGLSINDPTLRSTAIPKALPDDINQALLSLYLGASALDSAAYVRLVDDFIARFPKSPDGYAYRAQLNADADRYAEADADMKKAIEVAEKPDEPHYSYSRLVMQKALYKPEPPYDSWTLDKALEEARAANAINPQPAYRSQEADILFAKKDYQAAYDAYASLFNGPLRSPDLFYEAAKCKELLADTVARLALLDSMVQQFSKPYLKEAAPYILTRAQARLSAARFRDAVADLNDYEQLMAAQVNDNFYYLRYQAEVGGRLFQQALNDIDQAILRTDKPEFYLAEKASLQVRVGLYADAQQTAAECIRIAPGLSDGYLFLGLAQCLSGNKRDGEKNLRRAATLGDTQAEGLIEKYAR